MPKYLLACVSLLLAGACTHATPSPAAHSSCTDLASRAAEFHAANDTCVVDTDCVSVNTGCLPADDCGVVYLQRSAADGWAALAAESDQCNAPNACASCAAIPAAPAC